MVRFAAWLSVFVLALGNARGEVLPPPIAPRDPAIDVRHGDLRIDDYYWMRDRDDPRVLDYLKAENAYTQASMEHTKPLQERLFAEMLGRIQEDDESVPEEIDGYYYFSRTVKGKEYPILCRRHGSPRAPVEVLLDGNELAQGQPFLDVGTAAISPDHRLLAYSVDLDGSERFTLYVRNLATGEWLDEGIPNTIREAVWSNDSKHLFYTTQDETGRPDRVHRHAVGAARSSDSLVYHEEDDSYYLRLSRTRDRRFLLIDCKSAVTSETRFIPADEPMQPPSVLLPRRHNVEYTVDHHGTDIYLLTNDQAVNFRVLKVPESQHDLEHASEVVAHDPKVTLDGIELFENHIVLTERRDAQTSIRVRRLGSPDWRWIDFPDPARTLALESNAVFAAKSLRISHTSLAAPTSIFDVDMDTLQRILRKEQPVPGGFDRSKYESERMFAVAKDGTRIPMSIVHRKGVQRNGENPTLLYGYGAYGICEDPVFDANLVSLLDRGFVHAVAHIRGGGEVGRRWYEDGKYLKKRNTFDDFIAAAKMLVEERFTRKERLAILGGSAGGLLIGATIHQAPALCEVAVADVPFVDVITTMLDPTIPLTVTEWEEWGNPNDPVYYQYMKSYSPYDNVRSAAYPNLLVTTSLNDPRVGYWEPAKWVARLRRHAQGPNVILLRTNLDAGHAGASGRYGYLREIAFSHAFILDRLGIKD